MLVGKISVREEGRGDLEKLCSKTEGKKRNVKGYQTSDLRSRLRRGQGGNMRQRD